MKNWGGSGEADFPREVAHNITGEVIVQAEGYKRYHCWGCPIGCGGKMEQAGGEFPLELNDGVGHKPEYETLSMFGTNLLNDDIESIVKANEICNNLGLDTITVGATIGYAIECYENGLLCKEDTDDLDLTWGNAEAIGALTEKIGRREGFGEVLAHGVRVAWEKLGRIGTEYAVHVQGEEIPAHDPKYTPSLAVTYGLTATPGRHTQGGELLVPPEYLLPVPEGLEYSSRAESHYKLMTDMEVVNAAGLCMFGYLCFPDWAIARQLAAVTGWDIDMEEVNRIGMCIYTMRHAFNLREGLNPLERNIPGRLIGEPPLKTGMLNDVTVDYETLVMELLDLVGWDRETAVPSEESLRQLDMEFLVGDLGH